MDRPEYLSEGEFDASVAKVCAGAEKPPIIQATPFAWIDPPEIPRRRWLYGRHYVRKFVSETVAIGGVGKSSLALAESLAMVTGCNLLGIVPEERVNVWLWNGEDPADELHRRIAAAAIHYGITPSEIEGRLFVDSGRETKIILAEQTRTGAVIARPVVDAVIATIKANEIDLMIVDPFVASHRVIENDNPAIELVAAAWAEIADVTGCAIELVHHARKTGSGAEITVDDGRGGSALLAKVRSARVLNAMTEDEAARAGVEKRRAYFRVTNGKANLAPPAEGLDWYRLESVELGNGDSVGVVTPWEWPNALDGVSVSDLRKAQAAVADGRWRENPQAKDWVGIPIAKALGLDLTKKADRSKVSGALKIWTATGMFIVVEGLDDKRRMRSFVEVGEPAND